MRKTQTAFVPVWISTDRSPIYNAQSALSVHLGQDNSGTVIQCTTEEHYSMRDAKMFVVNYIDNSLLHDIDGIINHTCIFLPIDRSDIRWKPFSNNGLDNTEPLYWLFLRSPGYPEDQILCEKSSSAHNLPFPDSRELFKE